MKPNSGGPDPRRGVAAPSKPRELPGTTADLEAIKEGVADVIAGRTVSLSEADAMLRAELGIPSRGELSPSVEDAVGPNFEPTGQPAEE